MVLRGDTGTGMLSFYHAARLIPDDETTMRLRRGAYDSWRGQDGYSLHVGNARE